MQDRPHLLFPYDQVSVCSWAYNPVEVTTVHNLWPVKVTSAHQLPAPTPVSDAGGLERLKVGISLSLLVQFSRSVMSNSLRPQESQASLSINNSWSSTKLMSIESMMPSSHLILCRPLLLPPEIPPIIRVFSNESALHMRWPKYWSFSFSIIPSKEIPGLISFRMDWLDLLAVQGTLKSKNPLNWVRINPQFRMVFSDSKYLCSF